MVYSDAAKSDLEDFAVRYAEFRQGFNALIAPEGIRAPASTILLFRKAETLRGYVTSERRKAPENLLSYTTTVDFGALLALGLSGDVDEALNTTYEFDAAWMLPRIGYIVPLWMRQGTGEVLASLHVHKNKVVIWEPEDRLTTPLDRNSWLPWDRFFDLDSSSPEYTGKGGGEFTGVYQGQAWALMHAVLLEKGDPRARFQQLAATVHGTKADQAAVASFFGTAPDQISGAVRTHLGHDRTKEYPVNVAQLKAALRISPAPEAELRVQLGDLLQAAGNETEAQAQYERARYLAPHLAIVAEAQGRRAMASGDHSSAAQNYRDAIAAGSRDPRAYLISAEDRLNDASSGGVERAGSDADVAPQAIDEIRHALLLSPGNGQAYALLGRAYFVAGQVTAAQAEELTPALADPEFGLSIRFYQALVYERLGLTDRCLADLHFLADDSNTPQGLRNNAIRVLESKAFTADKNTVADLVAQKRYAEARSVIAAARQRGDQTNERNYDRLSSWIDDAAAKDRMNDLVARKNWAELRKAAAAYLRDHPQGALAGQARQMRQMANQKLHPAKADGSGNAELVSVNDGLIVVPHLQLHVMAGNRHWADFRNYLDHVESKILAQWDESTKQTPVPKFSGKVSVAFTLSASGDIQQIDRVTPADGIPASTRAACVAAIQGSAPFEHWPDDMTEILGQEQHLLISFAIE